MKTAYSGQWCRTVLIAATLTVLFCFGLTGCGSVPNPLAKKSITIEKQEHQPQSPDALHMPITDRDITVESAEAALSAKDMPRAELIATRLSAQPGMTQAIVARVSRVLAVSAAACRHPYLALQALERWREADPAADLSFDWQNAYASLLEQLPPHDASARAKAVADDENRPYTLRHAARLFLASRSWEKAAPTETVAPLMEMYTITRDTNQRAFMERSLFSALHAATPAAMQKLSSLVTEANTKEFPYAIIQLENIRRLALDPETKGMAATEAKKLAINSILVDASLLQAWDTASSPVSPLVPIQGRIVVMALPLSGPLKAVGERVAKGAQEAVTEFSERGHTVTLLTIDSEESDWLDRIAALPPEANIIGGPMRTQLVSEAHARELTKHRIFMTFTPSLGGVAEEGIHAWRFFSSPEDQLQTLLAFGEKMGFTNYSILLPADDAFATRMANLFASHATAKSASIIARAEYPANDTTTWHTIMETFMPTEPKNTSQAVFLPDAWRNMEILGEFFKFQENTQFLMGTSLWAQGLVEEISVPEQFEKAVFPGSWRQSSMPPAASRLAARYVQAGQGTPDFWSGLGYDFARFAAALHIPARWQAQTVNALLVQPAVIDWSIAPITWSPEGRATQHLFLFSPTDKGTVALTPEALEAKFSKVKAQ